MSDSVLTASPTSGNPILKDALTIASVAVFAIPGPAGPLIAASLTLLADLFGDSVDDPSNLPPPTATQIQSIDVGALDAKYLGLTSANVATAMQQFFAYVGPDLSFRVPIPTDLNNALASRPADPGVVFYKRLEDWVGGSVLLDQINTLNSASNNSGYESPQVIGLPAFLKAVSFYLAVYKVYSSARQIGGVPFDAGQCRFVKTELANWITYVIDQTNSIQQQITTRISKVTPVITYSSPAMQGLQAGEFAGGPVGGLFDVAKWVGLAPSENVLVYFADSGDPVPGVAVSDSDPDGSFKYAPDGAVASMYDAKNASMLELVRQQYVDQMQPTLIHLYADFDPATIHNVLTAWNAVAAQIDYMLAHDGNLPATHGNG